MQFDGHYSCIAVRKHDLACAVENVLYSYVRRGSCAREAEGHVQTAAIDEHLYRYLRLSTIDFQQQKQSRSMTGANSQTTHWKMYVDYSDSFPLHVCKGITVVSQHL
jgi:hypothetical protein